MSEKQDTNGVVSLLEIIKWILPFVLGFLGWYVSQVIAPLDDKIQYLEDKLLDYKELPQRISVLEVEKRDRVRRIEILERQMDELQEQILILTYGSNNE